uniref:Reverse transcriptase domain-containing protein n=1 Tax=Tanacetum cinerariifolium TaxID=118510 RepID=A0A699QZW8_TANCI|nr:hypothetical protein [Tanacetum cinerariifolium]
MDQTGEAIVTTTTAATTTTLKDCKNNTTASTSGQADKKPGASGRVFAITEDDATKTSGTITGTLFIYGHVVFVLFDTVLHIPLYLLFLLHALLRHPLY